MDKAGLRARVRTLTGIRSDDLRSDAEVDQVVNETYLELLAVRDWPFLQAEVETTASSASLPLPVGMLSPSAVVTPTRRLAMTTLDHLSQLAGDEGDPELYAVVGDGTVTLWPAPDTETPVVVRGLLHGSPLDDDDDEPLFPEAYHMVIAYEAAVRLLSEEGDDDSGRTDRYQTQGQALYSALVDRYERVRDRGTFVMSSRRYR